MTDDDPETMPSAAEMSEALQQMPAWEVDVHGEPRALATGDGAVPIADPPGSPELPPIADAASSPPPLDRILEAMLFLGGAPLTAIRAAEVVRGLSEQDFHDAIGVLARSYRSQGRPYQVQLQGQGYVLALRPRFVTVREKLHGSIREARLSQAAVDVLSLVAYRQPTTRDEIDALRGADSSSLLRLLIRHGLIAIQRGEDKESRYLTTPRFLQLFGLSSLDDLPQTQDLQRL
jgi:segregation and condensation protein B